MKKALSLLLVLVLFSSFSAFAELDDGIQFTPTLTNAFDLSSKEWFDDAGHRATLTIMLSIDLQILPDDIIDPNDWIARTTYVGKSGTTLLVFTRTDDHIVYMLYFPSLDTAKYYEVGFDMSASFADMVLMQIISETCEDGYYKNDPQTLLASIDALGKIFGS